MDDLITISTSLSKVNSHELLCRCNDKTEEYGLVLTNEALDALQKERVDVLRKVGRVECGSGILEKIVEKFCMSPYLNQSCYEETLSSFQELFYAFKNDCQDLVTDDELIDAMYLIYNDVARGDVDYLSTIPWETMCQIAQSGTIEGTELEMPSLDEEFFKDE